jgi:hypothetical protein
MKSLFVGSFMMLMALVAFTGCGNRGTSGGPGATDSDTKQPLYGEADNTFHLSVPSSLPFKSTTVNQGETAEVTIGIKRGKNFDQDVALTFTDLPTGVTLDPVTSPIKHGDTEAKFTLKAVDNAALGNFEVMVTGTPTKGADATNSFKITVGKIATFTLGVPSSLPLLSTTLQQGRTKDVSISIQRDKHFDQDVTLKFSNLPAGVTIDPATAVFKMGDTNLKCTFSATKDAVVGDYKVLVTGHPARGHDATGEFKITVSKK